MPEYDVFFCPTTTDRSFVERVATTLLSRNPRCGGIFSPGEEWHKLIDPRVAAIEDSHVFVVAGVVGESETFAEARRATGELAILPIAGGGFS